MHRSSLIQVLPYVLAVPEVLAIGQFRKFYPYRRVWQRFHEQHVFRSRFSTTSMY